MRSRLRYLAWVEPAIPHRRATPNIQDHITVTHSHSNWNIYRLYGGGYENWKGFTSIASRLSELGLAYVTPSVSSSSWAILTQGIA